mmetsp:Transcript_28972/g.46857  ORF Transcript_28972/g.46857 Transcript_28972/m.46857 type:complete len:207 (-) Transcript_28972:1185-1805(-)
MKPRAQHVRRSLPARILWKGFSAPFRQSADSIALILLFILIFVWVVLPSDDEQDPVWVYKVSTESFEADESVETDGNPSIATRSEDSPKKEAQDVEILSVCNKKLSYDIPPGYGDFDLPNVLEPNMVHQSEGVIQVPVPGSVVGAGTYQVQVTRAGTTCTVTVEIKGLKRDMRSHVLRNVIVSIKIISRMRRFRYASQRSKTRFLP